MTDGAQAMADQHWLIGSVLLLLALVVSVLAVRRSLPPTRGGPAVDQRLHVAVLLGLLGATALAVVGAGLVSTGDRTLGGWGPFVVAAAVVLGPPVLSHAGRTPASRTSASRPISTAHPGSRQHHTSNPPLARDEAGRGVSH